MNRRARKGHGDTLRGGGQHCVCVCVSVCLSVCVDGHTCV